ncbi:MAG TPA: right-handed parallel beta-helix repeat-containing protein [Actinomycetota bacterium]|nr:right-handed parallel beta-helix repeat-containing protein [Actinomycetota bacterium]
MGFGLVPSGLAVLPARLLAIGLVLQLLGSVNAAMASHTPTHFAVRYEAPSYVAQSQTKTYTGALKMVVESAVSDLKGAGGGTVSFQAGVFDLGPEYFRLEDMTDITIEGKGMDVTTIKNHSDALDDTEPFNTKGATRVVIRDLTVVAGGIPRTTSDAIDFDRGNHNLVERVKITASRGKGIIFDGKDADWNSVGNTVRSCVISGTHNDGIQFLASSNNRVEGCTIHDTVRDGIEATKSQTIHAQPNKKSNDNVIIGNTIDNAGENGIRIHSSDRNLISGNHITNSSDDTPNLDGIRITSTDSITCDDNRVEGNTATDTQATKTQAYGLNIASPLCNRTFVGTNDFSGNKVGAIRDLGTNTQYGTTASADPPPSCRGRKATLWGTAATETLMGTSENDVIVGQGGSDTILGKGGADLVCAGPGADRVFGGAGNDRIFGGSGKDALRGGSGKDRLIGGVGNDRLVGGKGKDTCAGGPGTDTAIGCELGSGA